MSDDIKCPFIYADGTPCCGNIYKARAYGPGDRVKKVRLWCSDKDDHAGASTHTGTKMRMEFYPNELPPGMIERISASDLWG